MERCRRCGKEIVVHRWLLHKLPEIKCGIKYLFTGYATESFEYEICDECSKEFRRFLEGEETRKVDRVDRCGSCGAGIEPGKPYCPNCGAKVVEE